MKLKIAALLLAMLIVTLSAFGCSDTKDTTDDSNAAITTSRDAGEGDAENTEMTPDIPDG